MTVYVDTAKHQYGRMVMCHMGADTLEELHAMAAKIGVARRWFQNKPGRPHYDICYTMKLKAIALGAALISQKDFALKLRGVYGERHAGEVER